MTQKEAIIKALEELGGRAKLKDIYLRVIKMAKFKPDSDKEATMRATMLRHPETFQRSESKPKGWWELTSFQEEIAARDSHIAELEAQVATKDAEIAALKKVPTEDDFVRKLLAATMRLYKRDEKELDVVRKLFFTVGHKDAEQELDAWIDGRESKHAVAVGKLEIRQGGTNINTNYGPNIEHSGGTLSLPEGFGAEPLPDIEGVKRTIRES